MEIDSGPGPQGDNVNSSYALGIDGLVGRTISLWGRKLPQYIVIVGITSVALTIIQSIVLITLFGIVGIEFLAFIGTSPMDSVFSIVLTTEPIPFGILMIIFILSIFSLLVYSIVAGAAITYANMDYENPESASVGEAFSIAFERAYSLIGVQVLQSLIVLGIAVLAILTMFIEILLGMIVLLLAVYIAVRLAPAPAIVINEGRSSYDALSRSWQITGGLFWHVFLGQLLMGIVVIIIDIAIGVAAGLILIAFIPSVDLVTLISVVLASFILSPINYIYIAVLYKDLEARGTAGGYDWWQ